MLTIQDLIEINYIPQEAEISLELFVNFYEQYLCKRIFIFELANGEVVKLFFRDATELFHVSGIDHIYTGYPMDGTRFIKGIKDTSLTLDSVKTINPNAYKDYEIRIRSMACIDTIIKNCEYLYFPSGKIAESDIEVKYLLLKGLDGKNIHLGIDTYKVGKPYFSRTLLITEGSQEKKFIDRADERLRVVSLQIKDKATDKVLINVERKQAMVLAETEIRNITNRWLTNDFPSLFKEFLATQEECEDVSNTEIVITRKQKDVWKKQLLSKLEAEKDSLKTMVAALDPYWAGKIVGESLRNYGKDFAMKDIERELLILQSNQ